LKANLFNNILKEVSLSFLFFFSIRVKTWEECYVYMKC
jgi:hypothetical protein